jgi:hypothetical protein
MKYILALAIWFAFGSGTLASAQNADVQNKDMAASRHQSIGAMTRSRATVSTPATYGTATAAKSSKLNQELGRIERENVKPKTAKPVRHVPTHVANAADQGEKNTKPINFGHRHQATRNKGSSNRSKK